MNQGRFQGHNNKIRVNIKKKRGSEKEQATIKKEKHGSKESKLQVMIIVH